MLSEMLGVCESLPKSPPWKFCPKVGAKYPGAALLQLMVFGICGVYPLLAAPKPVWVPKSPVMLKPSFEGSTAAGFDNAMGLRNVASAKTNSLVSVGENTCVTFAL